MKTRNRKEKKKEFYPRARITIPDRRPYNLEQFLQLFFGEKPDNLKVEMAKALLEEIRSKMPRGWNSEEWIDFILKLMLKHYGEDAEALLEYYHNELQWTAKKSEIPKLIEEKCLELGLTQEGEKKARGREVPLFRVYRGTYSVVVKILKEAKLIQKVNGYYQLSDEFERILEGIAEFWRFWRKEKIE